MRVPGIGVKAQAGMTDEAVDEAPPERSRWRRWRARLALAAGVLVVLILLFGGVLFAVTPSAGAAPSIAEHLAALRGIAYPGPAAPPDFAKALIATEDHRFYSDPGVDIWAVGRVVAGYLAGKRDQGGATIDQQLAKMLYTPGRHSLAAEVEQVVLAVKLHFTFSPDEILRMYAETAYYGHGYYGLHQAACGYFGRPPATMTLVQAAMMAGVVNAPSEDDPVAHPAQARARLVHVLGRMLAVGTLTPAQEKKELAAPLGLAAAPGCR